MNQEVEVRQSSVFRRAYKRLHVNQKADVDDAVSDIVQDPNIGVEKRGDLAGVYVYKFKCCGQVTLLAYEFDWECRTLDLLNQ